MVAALLFSCTEKSAEPEKPLTVIRGEASIPCAGLSITDNIWGITDTINVIFDVVIEASIFGYSHYRDDDLVVRVKELPVVIVDTVTAIPRIYMGDMRGLEM